MLESTAVDVPVVNVAGEAGAAGEVLELLDASADVTR
jgi:hypothetical protein